MRICEFEGCEKKYVANGYCSGHSAQVRRGQSLRPLKIFLDFCSFDGCKNAHACNGYCSGHNAQIKRGAALHTLRTANSDFLPRTWSSNEIYWMAGLFEGEGTIGIVKAKKSGDPYVSVALGMTDLDVINKLHQTAGIGTVNHNKLRPNRTKPMFIWQIAKREDVLRFLTAIASIMGERRGARIMEALEVIHEQIKPQICSYCGIVYNRVKRGQKYCNIKCRKKANR